jgi:hypothetical protein
VRGRTEPWGYQAKTELLIISENGEFSGLCYDRTGELSV